MTKSSTGEAATLFEALSRCNIDRASISFSSSVAARLGQLQELQTGCW
jgi:hypothetical protein